MQDVCIDSYELYLSKKFFQTNKINLQNRIPQTGLIKKKKMLTFDDDVKINFHKKSILLSGKNIYRYQ